MRRVYLFALALIIAWPVIPAPVRAPIKTPTAWMRLTVKPTTVAVNDSNVPVYFDIPDSLVARAISSGKNIIFTDSLGDTLPRILVNFGQARAVNWCVVRVPALNNGYTVTLRHEVAQVAGPQSGSPVGSTVTA